MASSSTATRRRPRREQSATTWQRLTSPLATRCILCDGIVYARENRDFG